MQTFCEYLFQFYKLSYDRDREYIQVHAHVGGYLSDDFHVHDHDRVHVNVHLQLYFHDYFHGCDYDHGRDDDDDRESILK